MLQTERWYAYRDPNYLTEARELSVLSPKLLAKELLFPIAWNFEPLETSALWEMCMGPNWWFLFEEGPLSSFFAPIVHQMSLQITEHSSMLYEVQAEVEYEILAAVKAENSYGYVWEGTAPEGSSLNPFSYSWVPSSQEIGVLAVGHGSAGATFWYVHDSSLTMGFVRTIRMVPVFERMIHG